MNLLPLFELERDGISEISVFGEIASSRSPKERWQNSQTRKAFPARSLLKPFQVLASGILGEKESNPWWHVALGSISNEEDQNKQLRQWIQGNELEDLAKGLQLSPSFPMDDRYRILLKEQGANPEVVFHTCFSKHLAILKACKRNQWSTKDYLSETHPFHLELIKILQGLLKPARNTLQFVQDGCRLPSPVLFLDEINRASNDLIGASLQLILDGRLNEHQLPPGTMIVAAINPDDGNYSVNSLDPAMMDRMVVCEVEADAHSWLRYAKSYGVNDKVVEFITKSTKYIHHTPKDGGKGTSPRSWTRLSKYLNYCEENKQNQVIST
jgi:hypothetical protein